MFLDLNINELSCLGFFKSYDEVVRYKQSIIQSETLENVLSKYIPGTFTHVADNFNHKCGNTRWS